MERRELEPHPTPETKEQNEQNELVLPVPEAEAMRDQERKDVEPEKESAPPETGETTLSLGTIEEDLAAAKHAAKKAKYLQEALTKRTELLSELRSRAETAAALAKEGTLSEEQAKAIKELLPERKRLAGFNGTVRQAFDKLLEIDRVLLSLSDNPALTEEVRSKIEKVASHRARLVEALGSTLRSVLEERYGKPLAAIEKDKDVLAALYEEAKAEDKKREEEIELRKREAELVAEEEARKQRDLAFKMYSQWEVRRGKREPYKIQMTDLLDSLEGITGNFLATVYQQAYEAAQKLPKIRHSLPHERAEEAEKLLEMLAADLAKIWPQEQRVENPPFFQVYDTLDQHRDISPAQRIAFVRALGERSENETKDFIRHFFSLLFLIYEDYREWLLKEAPWRKPETHDERKAALDRPLDPQEVRELNRAWDHFNKFEALERWLRAGIGRANLPEFRKRLQTDDEFRRRVEELNARARCLMEARQTLESILKPARKEEEKEEIQEDAKPIDRATNAARRRTQQERKKRERSERDREFTQRLKSRGGK